MKRNSRSVSVFLVLAALGFGRISHADLIVNNGKLDLGGTLTVTGDYIQNGGILLMDNSSSVLDISGDFTVNTNAVNTTLSDGRIQIEGNFTQSGVSTDDFRASGNHTVELDGTADQSIAFGSAGIGSNNHFGHLEIGKASGKVSVTTDLAVVSNGLILQGKARDSFCFHRKPARSTVASPPNRACTFLCTRLSSQILLVYTNPSNFLISQSSSTWHRTYMF